MAANDSAAVRAVLSRNPFIRRLHTPEGTILLTAKRSGAEAALAALLERVNEDELNVYEASALGRAGRLKTILGQSRTRMDEPGPLGMTPLALAAYFGHVDAVKVLLEHGAQETSGPRGGTTPLELARARGHEEVVRILTSRGTPAASDSRKTL